MSQQAGTFWADTDREARIVTPPRIASLGDRFIAFLLELIVYVVFMVAWWTVAIVVFDQSGFQSIETNDFVVNPDGTFGQGRSTTWTFGDARVGWLGWLAYCVYFVVSEVRYGQTLGKRVIGMKVADARSGDKPTIGQSIIRLIFFEIGMIGLFIPTWIIMAASEKNQRTGDSVAKTVVVYK